MPVAFVFPGQGSQRAGMFHALLAQPESLIYVEWAEKCSGLPLRSIYADGPQDRLAATEAAQPAIVAVSLALAELAQSAGIKPACVAGHSLGEYSGAAAAGALDWRDAISAAATRGRLMAAAEAARPGAMAAIIGLVSERIQSLCREASSEGTVVIANLNGAAQIVVSGDVAAVQRVVALASAAGADQSVRLPVGAAFHSPLMAQVEQEMQAFLRRLTFGDPKTAMVAGFNGRVVTTAAEVRDALVYQVTAPVRWDAVLSQLTRLGADSFLELGPGRVLTGLTHLSVPDVRAHAADSPEKLRRFAAGAVPAAQSQAYVG